MDPNDWLDDILGTNEYRDKSGRTIRRDRTIPTCLLLILFLLPTFLLLILLGVLFSVSTNFVQNVPNFDEDFIYNGTGIVTTYNDTFNDTSALSRNQCVWDIENKNSDNTTYIVHRDKINNVTCGDACLVGDEGTCFGGKCVGKNKGGCLSFNTTVNTATECGGVDLPWIDSVASGANGLYWNVTCHWGRCYWYLVLFDYYQVSNPLDIFICQAHNATGYSGRNFEIEVQQCIKYVNDTAPVRKCLMTTYGCATIGYGVCVYYYSNAPVGDFLDNPAYYNSAGLNSNDLSIDAIHNFNNVQDDSLIEFAALDALQFFTNL